MSLPIWNVGPWTSWAGLAIAVECLLAGLALGAAGSGLWLWLHRSSPALRPARHDEQLDELANRADAEPANRDRVEMALMPGGQPDSPEAKAQFFELYKIMVQTSESLVARRQGTNTFFLTANALLLTAIGLFVRVGFNARTHSLAIAVLCATGLIVSWAWRTLLVSFGQLNKGKFAVILRLEKALAAAIFDAEWEALDRGENKQTYRSFTRSESRVPLLFMTIYLLAGLVATLISLGWRP